EIKESWNVGRALDRRVATHGHDPAAGAAYVAQQQLQDPGGADDLRSEALLRPTDRVDDRRGPLSTRILGHSLCHLKKEFAGRATDPFDHLGGVAGVVPFEDLEDAAGVPQTFVSVWPMLGWTGALLPVATVRAGILAALRGRSLVDPAAVVVGPFFGVEPGEKSVAVLGVAIRTRDNARSVCVGEDIVVEPLVVRQHIVDQAAKKGDVGPRPSRHVEVGAGRGPAEVRVHVDNGRPVFFRFHWPAKS